MLEALLPGGIKDIEARVASEGVLPAESGSVQSSSDESPFGDRIAHGLAISVLIAMVLALVHSLVRLRPTGRNDWPRRLPNLASRLACGTRYLRLHGLHGARRRRTHVRSRRGLRGGPGERILETVRHPHGGSRPRLLLCHPRYLADGEILVTAGKGLVLDPVGGCTMRRPVLPPSHGTGTFRDRRDLPVVSRFRCEHHDRLVAAVGIYEKGEKLS